MKKYLFFGLLFFICHSSLASEISPDFDLVDEVERILLFNDDGKTADQVAQQNLDKRQDFLLSKKHDDNLSSKDDLKITVNNSKIANLDVRAKEKMAYNAILSNQYEMAIELYKQVIADEPENNYALFSLATLYQKMGQFRQAKAIYYSILKNNPKNKAEIISNIFVTLAAESPRDTLYLLSRLASNYPNSSYILAQAAITHSNAKKYDKAIEFMQKAVVLSPERLDYRYNLAIIYDKSGDFQKAAENYQEVAKNYNDKFASAISLQAVNLRLESLSRL